MLTITINRKPLSANAAWQGRRYSSPAKKAYEAALRLLLPNRAIPGPYYRSGYDFYLVNFSRTDAGKLEKVLTDCIVKRGIIKDDRYILEYRIRKFKAAVDKIVIRIEGCGLDIGAEAS